MELERFRELAAEMWEAIPAELREGVEAVSVEERAEPHPHLEEVYTLGECHTEEWPSQYGGPGDTRSHLVLYYGSFRALAELDPGFEWEREMWETVLHELLHHRESAAGAHDLETYDWAVEQHQLRRAGRAYDPAFYRALPAGPEGAVRLDSEIYVEAEPVRRGGEVRFRWRGREYSLRVPAEELPAFVRVRNLAHGRLWVVARRARPWWRRWRPERPGPPVELERRALPVPMAGKR